MKQSGFALIQTMMASIIIALVMAGAIAYQTQVTKTLTAKKYMAAIDKVETNLRIKIGDFNSLYVSAANEPTSALAKCVLIDVLSGLKTRDSLGLMPSAIHARIGDLSLLFQGSLVTLRKELQKAIPLEAIAQSQRFVEIASRNLKCQCRKVVLKGRGFKPR